MTMTYATTRLPLLHGYHSYHRLPQRCSTIVVVACYGGPASPIACLDRTRARDDCG
jgi:hypothetical protein